MLIKLPHLGVWTEQRRLLAQRYRQQLDPSKVRLPQLRAESEPTYRSYTILVENQARVYLALRDAGVDAVLHYAPPVYQQPVYRQHRLASAQLPVTEFVSQHLICRPVTPELSAEEIDSVCEVVNRTCARGWA